MSLSKLIFVGGIACLTMGGIVLSGVGCGGGSTTKTGDGGGSSRWVSVVGEKGYLAQTHDEASWSGRFVETIDLHAVTCVNALIGWAAGSGGVVSHTTDGGQTWTTQDSHLTSLLTAVQFLDTDRGVVAGESGALAVTSDGGGTWTPVTSLDANARGTNWRAASSAPDAHLFVVVGDGGVIATSFDSGTSWATQSIATAADFTGVSAAWGGQQILATDKAGTVWESDDSASSFHVAYRSGSPLESVSFGPAGHALAVGANGAAFSREANGTWSSVATGAGYDLHAVLITGKSGYGSSGRTYAAGDHGTLLVTDDFGAHWATVDLDGATNALYSLDDL
jgi:photosystem II stability/assembly factor-like uncharacterized protein